MQHLQQIADFSILDERMSQGELGLDLVAVPAAVPLAQHVALLHQLGQDPVGGALGDPDRRGDVSQANARIVGDTREDVSVVGQEIPSRGYLRSRFLLLISRKKSHEFMITFVSSQSDPPCHPSRRQRWEGTEQ